MSHFRWPLRALERRREAALESARLGLAALQGEARKVDGIAARWAAHQAEQEALARDCIRRDPLAGRAALAYLGLVRAQLTGVEQVRRGIAQQVDTARAQCLERQRQLASVQALRENAQRLHGIAEHRRAAREADIAWLTREQQQRAHGRHGGEA